MASMAARRKGYLSEVRRSAGGAAMLEAALLLPVLVLLFAGAYDGFRAMQAYATLSEVVQEAARYAARVQNLEPGTFVSGPANAGTVPPGHTTVHARIRSIMSSKSWHSPLDNIEIISQLQNASGTGITGALGPSNPAYAGIIGLRVTGTFRGMFTAFVFNNLQLQVTVAASQL